jgi:exonuclease SbcD
MRVLHTSDWHVGRTIQGRSREDEHRAVLAEIAEIVRREKVDLVLVAGDVFDHSAPNAVAEEVVYRALLDLTADGAQVALVAGNHDNGRRFSAVRPFLALARVHALGELARPGEGGCIEIPTRSGEVARVAKLPWVSQRGIVRAKELMEMDDGGQLGTYQQWLADIMGRLCGGFGPREVNILMGHVTVAGAKPGGGERQSDSIFDYWVPQQSLPRVAQYCALGHIHRQQRLPGSPSTAWYSGAPMHLDFGQTGKPGVLLFEAKAGLPVTGVEQVPLSSARPLLTVTGTLAQVQARAADIDPRAHVRVQLDEAPRLGLADEVYKAIPNAVKVELIPREVVDGPARINAASRTPHELYEAYLQHIGTAQPAPLLALFDELEAEVH